MLEPRTAAKRLPVAGIPGKSPVCVPDMAHSMTAHWLVAKRLINRYLKSGTAAKAPSTKLRSSCLPRATTPEVTSSKKHSSTKRARTLSESLDESLDDQAIAQSSSICSKSAVANDTLVGELCRSARTRARDCSQMCADNFLWGRSEPPCPSGRRPYTIRPRHADLSRPTPDCGGKSHLSARLLRLLQVAEDNAPVDTDHAGLTSQLSV
jgi:hypothetical protein